MKCLSVKLSTLKAAAEALLRVNNVRVLQPDGTDEEIRTTQQRAWTERDEVVLQQWRELQGVFTAIRQAKGAFPPLPDHPYPRPKLLRTSIDVNE